MSRPLAAIILAAGKGTRMKSDRHKVLHPIAGRPMIEHLLESVEALGAERIVVVVGDRREQLEAALAGRVEFAVQEPQLGTAHAVLQAKPALAGFEGDVLLLSGDVPFIRPATMRAMLDALHGGADPAAVVLGFRPPDAGAYGRVVAGPDGRVARIVELRDANDEERAIGLCNSNLFAVRSGDLWTLLEGVGNDNSQGEYYLTDIVAIAAAAGRATLLIEGDAAEAIGPNSRADFALAETAWQARRRAEAMAEGVTMIAPETVWFSWDTKLGRDVLIEPNVIFEPGVTVGEGSRIEAHLIVPENSDIPAGTVVSSANRFSFGRTAAIQSPHWTGRYSASHRAQAIVSLGPAVISGLTTVIQEIERRSHNQPPDLLDDTANGQLLNDLKELRARLNECIHELERGYNETPQLEEIAELYRRRIAPWLTDRIADAGHSLNSILALSPALLLTYLGLSRFFDTATFAAIMSAAVGGVLGGSLQKRGNSQKG